MKKVSVVGLSYAVCTFAVASIALSSLAFADTGRGAGSANSARTATLTRVLAKLQNLVPDQAHSPTAVGNALANETGGSSAAGEQGSNGGNGGSNGQNGGGNNGGVTAGNGGNGGAGGNASPGGLVRAGNTVSNATAVNAINTNIIRISTR